MSNMSNLHHKFFNSGCLNCGNKPMFHCVIDGNDFDFCSIDCIEKYSKSKGCKIILIDCFNDGTNYCAILENLRQMGHSCDKCPYCFHHFNELNEKVKVVFTRSLK